MLRKTFMLLVLFISGVAMASLQDPKPPFYEIENPDQAMVLRKYAQPVSFPLSDADKSIIKALCSAADGEAGVGLAAPQIGYSRQIVMIEIDQAAALLRGVDTLHPRQIYINPSYEPTLDAQVVLDWEGCFSVNSLVGKVPRFDRILFRYQDIEGQWHHELVEGFFARVAQHETDHIRGTLMVDRLTKETTHGTREEMRAARLAELTPEQKALYQELSAPSISEEKKS